MTSELPRLPVDEGDDSLESRIDARDRAARERAVDPRFNVALEASAGTGQTRVLVDRYLKDRPTNAGDVAKVGAGTAIGAVAGRVIGGNTKGAVIGGIIGGAIGTQRAIQTQDRDVVVPAGSRVQLTLSQELAL